MCVRRLHHIVELKNITPPRRMSVHLAGHVQPFEVKTTTFDISIFWESYVTFVE